MPQQPVTHLKHPEFHGRIGIARGDVTPPLGIYARSWGSAKHDVAEGIHQPLLASCLVLQDMQGKNELILLAVDAILIPPDDIDIIRKALLARFSLRPDQLMLHPSHSHSAPFAVRRHADRPGGNMIAPYLDTLPKLYGDVIEKARQSVQEATLGWAYGKCGLAFNRDSIDQASDRDICGLNVEKKADDTLLIGRVTDKDGKIFAILVNYACHPVSLGGGNRLISPDYVGTLRNIVESENKGATCVFFHGASGDLTPRRSYESNVEAAEQNGRELAFAALSVLSSMYPPGQELVYQGIEESGTALGIWRLMPKARIDEHISGALIKTKFALHNLPSNEELKAAMAVATERFEIERIERSFARRASVGDGKDADFSYTVWRLGEAFLVSTPAEPYSRFQMDLRAKYPDTAIAVLNLSDGGVTYLPIEAAFKRDTYQVRVALYEPGALTQVTKEVVAKIQSLM